jgi:hypothetical protein
MQSKLHYCLLSQPKQSNKDNTASFSPALYEWYDCFQARSLEEERSGRQAAEAERAAIAEEAAGKASAAAVVAEEAAAVQASLAARLAAAEADLADTRGKLADARTDAEKKLREHWETSRCVFLSFFQVGIPVKTHSSHRSNFARGPCKQCTDPPLVVVLRQVRDFLLSASFQLTSLRQRVSSRNYL